MAQGKNQRSFKVDPKLFLTAVECKKEGMNCRGCNIHSYAKLNLTLCVFLRAKTSSMQRNYENNRIQT